MNDKLDALIMQCHAAEIGMNGTCVPLETTEFCTTGSFVPHSFLNPTAIDCSGTQAPPPWPADHKGHWWSGWPGAYCLRCGSEDPTELALADGWYDPYTEKWDTEEHRLEVEKYQKCPADDPAAYARQLIEDLRGGVPGKCSFCNQETPADKLEPEEAGEWVCHTCVEKAGGWKAWYHGEDNGSQQKT